MKKAPYRLYLSEEEIPKKWYNLRADMKELPEPMINPATMKPALEEDLYPVFCKELAHQEMDDKTRYVDIPDEVREMYKIYRPSPLCRAYNLEKALGTPAKIYYKFEGNNTSGSHKLNSAIAQAYYAKKEGLKVLLLKLEQVNGELLYQKLVLILGFHLMYIWLRYLMNKNQIEKI